MYSPSTLTIYPLTYLPMCHRKEDRVRHVAIPSWSTGGQFLILFPVYLTLQVVVAPPSRWSFVLKTWLDVDEFQPVSGDFARKHIPWMYGGGRVVSERVQRRAGRLMLCS